MPISSAVDQRASPTPAAATTVPSVRRMTLDDEQARLVGLDQSDDPPSLEELVGHLLDVGHRGAGRDPVTDRPQQVPPIEGRRLFGEPLGAQQVLVYRLPIGTDGGSRDPVEGVGQGGRVPADLDGLGLPDVAHRSLVEGLLLGLAGGQGGELGGPGGAEPDLVEVLLDLLAAVREVVPHLLVDPDHIGDAIADRAPFDAEPAGELVAQVGFVEVAGGGRVQVERATIQRPPGPVGALGHVRHQQVGVQMGVPGPAGAMPEPGRDEPVDLDLVDAVLPGSGPGGLPFEVVEGGVDGRIVRVAHRSGRVGIAEPGQDRHGLGSPEGQVETGDLAAGEPAELLARGRVLAGPDGVEVVSGDVAIEAERSRRSAGPAAGGFADTAVVLVDSVGHGLEVVALAGQLDLADTEHRRAPFVEVPTRVAIRRAGRDQLRAPVPGASGCKFVADGWGALGHRAGGAEGSCFRAWRGVAVEGRV